MSSCEWGKNDADVNLFCDACSFRLGFWFPAGNIGFQHALAPGMASPGIFFHEAWTIISALVWAVHNTPLRPGLRIALYSNSSNMVDMFNMLCAQPAYNPLALTAVNIALDFHIEFHVFHIPGEDNIVSDALSHFCFDTLATFAPLLHILQFEPPQLALGAAPS